MITIPSRKLFSSTAKKFPYMIPNSTVLEEFCNIEFFLSKVIKLLHEFLTQTPPKVHAIIGRSGLVVGDDLH